MSPLVVRAASADEIDALGTVLGAAFDADPVINWLVRQDEERQSSIEALFREVTRHAYFPEGETYLATNDDEPLGAAVWRPPGVGEPPPIPEIDRLFDDITDDIGRRRSRQIGELVEARHPTERHRYLYAIGVRPEIQGSGAGSALMRSGLDLCDAEGTPAYLENTNERNLPFYERHGFGVRERVQLPDGGPSVWLMWREPSAG